MCKVVSSSDGFTICTDEEGCVVYKTGEHMTGKDVGDHLGITKAAVSGILTRSISKIYKRLRKKHFDLTTFEIIVGMVELFNISTEKQYKDFLKLLPNEIRRILYEEAYKTGCGY